MKAKIAKLTFEREAGTLFGANAERLDVLAANVANHNLAHNQLTTRANIAAEAESFGLRTHVGGHHVAIHLAGAGDLGARFAIITGNFGDWI